MAELSHDNIVRLVGFVEDVEKGDSETEWAEVFQNPRIKREHLIASTSAKTYLSYHFTRSHASGLFRISHGSHGVRECGSIRTRQADPLRRPVLAISGGVG